jgi:hypothetical protein
LLLEEDTYTDCFADRHGQRSHLCHGLGGP